MTKKPIPKFMRKQYLDGECTHAEYYRSIVHELGIDYSSHDRLEDMRAMYETGDTHLNRIPLRSWDLWGSWMLSDRAAHDAFRSRNDGLSLAGIVSTLKTAATDAILASSEAPKAKP